MNKKLFLTLCILLVFVSGCDEGEPVYNTIELKNCCTNETQLYLYSATNLKDNTYFNTTYDIILNEKYLGKFKGEKNSYLNLSCYDELDMLIYSDDCKMYKMRSKLIVPDKPTYYFEPRLECAKNLYFEIYDLDSIPLKEKNYILTTSKDYIWITLKIENNERYNVIGCNYDRKYIGNLEIKDYNLVKHFPRASLETEEDVNGYYELEDLTESKIDLIFNLKEYYETFTTNVTCYFFDNDYYINEHFEISLNNVDYYLNDLGLENPSFNLTIIKT